MPETPDRLPDQEASETKSRPDSTEAKPEVKPPPGIPPGEYDAGPATGKTVAQAALEGAQTNLDASKAATAQAEAKVETAQIELAKKDQDINVEPPATGKRPASPFYSPDEWRLLAWTFGIGMIGGGFAVMLHYAPKEDSTLGTILSGGLAAVIAVFFLARTDTDKRIHLTIFATLCGFVGSPLVKESVSTFGKGFGIEDKALASSHQSNDLADDLKKSVQTAEGKEDAGRQLQKIEKSAQSAIENTAKGDENVKSAVSANVEKTVDALQQIAQTAPLETIRTVENIGVTAAANDQPKIAERALLAARQLSTTGDDGAKKAAQATMSVLSRVLNIKPRIHLELASAIDPASLDRLKESMAQTGYALVGPIQTSLPDRKAQVIYYDAADENEALYIISKLQEAGVRNLEPKPLKHEKPPDFRPRHFDLQLGTDTLPVAAAPGRSLSPAGSPAAGQNTPPDTTSN